MKRRRWIWILALVMAPGCAGGVKDAAHGVYSLAEDVVDVVAPMDTIVRPPPVDTVEVAPAADTLDAAPAEDLELPCAPSCDGIECGPDGCGGVCGTCPEAAPLCEDGACVVDCEPACDGKECGWDGCDGVCGHCIEGALCDDGTCVAASGEKWLSNETFGGAAADQAFPAEVAVGDVLAVRISGGPVDHPFRVKTLLFRLVSNPTFPGASCAPFHVRIWRDIAMPEPQELLFDSEVAGLGPFDLPGDGGPALVDLLALGVDDLVIGTGAIRVGIVAAGYTCDGTPSNLKVPVPFRDPVAAVTPATNWFFGAAGPGEVAAWHDAAGLGVEGNFVFRVLVDYGFVGEE